MPSLYFLPAFYLRACTTAFNHTRSANPDVQLVLDKVVAAGGKILVPKMEISPEYGYMGVFIDTEGNRIALHSVPQS